MVASKRKATDAGDGASSSKKSRTATHDDVRSLVKAILAKPDTYPILDDADFVRRQLVQVAEYAHHLEQQAQSASSAGPAPKSMTPEQLQASVEKLRKAANSGIKKQMAWKPSCKSGSAKWSYDGICTNPVAFGMLLGLESPPKFKAHKVAIDEFNKLLGGIQASARYSHLYITGSHVNVRWSQDSGEFKFSGTYGTLR